MKTITLRFVFLLAVLMLFNSLLALAQEDEKTKVHLKVKKNDAITLDTTLFIKSGADSDELKNLVKEFAGIEGLDLQMISSDDIHVHAYKMKKGSDSLKTVAIIVGEDDEVDTLNTLTDEGEKQVQITIKSGDKNDEFVWVSKDSIDDKHIIMKSGKGDEMVFGIVSGDEKDLELIHKKGDILNIISEEDLEKIGKDEKGNYYIVRKKSDIGEDDEIVIKKKDGNVVIMKGDEIHGIKGKNVYIKTYDNEEGSFDIFLDKDEDGTVIVKKSITVMKKKGEDGEEEIEITIEEGDETKLKEGTREKKVVKKKKKEAK